MVVLPKVIFIIGQVIEHLFTADSKTQKAS